MKLCAVNHPYAIKFGESYKDIKYVHFSKDVLVFIITQQYFRVKTSQTFFNQNDLACPLSEKPPKWCCAIKSILQKTNNKG